MAMSTNFQQIEVASFQQALSASLPTFATTKKYLGEVAINAQIHEAIHYLSDTVSVGRKLNDIQIEVICEALMEDYHYLNLGDLKLCFKRGVRGIYGQLYDRLDAMIVLDWVRRYAEERADHAAREVMNKNKTQPDVLGGSLDPQQAEQMRSRLRGMMKRLEDKLASNKPEQKTSFVYQTIEQYCRAKGFDPAEKEKELIEEWGKEYAEWENPEISQDLFYHYKANLFLAGVNTKVSNDCPI